MCGCRVCQRMFAMFIVSVCKQQACLPSQCAGSFPLTKQFARRQDTSASLMTFWPATSALSARSPVRLRAEEVGRQAGQVLRAAGHEGPAEA